MDIEEIAVLAVKNEIVKYSDSLTAYIDTKEKTPMWDGYIYVYKQHSKYKTNKEFEGKIGVQVKGQTVKELPKGNSKYSIKVDYLRAYKKDKKGVLLLVAKIVDYKNTKLFYANLLPVDLREILKKVKENQREVTIDIKPIKEKTSSSLKMICLNFLKNANEQIKIESKNIDEIKEIKEIKIPIIGEEKYIEEYLFNNDVYSYAIDKETNEKYALPKLRELQKFSTNKVDIYINKKKYYDKITFVKNKNEEYALYGKSTKIFLDKNKIVFKTRGNLYDRIHDSKFIIALMENRFIKVNGKTIKFPIQIKRKEEREYLENLKKELINLEKIKKTFDKFEVNFETELEDLTNKDWQNIDLFIRINEGKPIKEIKESKLYDIQISKYKIAFLAIVDTNKNIRTYNYFSDLDNVVKTFYYTKDGKQISISPYINLNRKSLLEYSNLNIEIIKKSFDSIGDNEETIEKYNLWLLEVLHAYDESQNKNILDLAIYINEKILEKRKNTVDILNKMQIIKRQRKFNDEEKDFIYDLRKKENDIIIQCAIAILLENKPDFERYFSKLDIESSKNFELYPICNLIKK